MIQQLLMGGGEITHTFSPAGGAAYFEYRDPVTYPSGGAVTISPGIPINQNITLVFPPGSYDTAGGEQRHWTYYLNNQYFRPTSGGTYTYSFSGLLTSIQLVYYEYPYGSSSHFGYISAIDGARNWTYVNGSTITIP